jgi:D-threonate/D-erythronate kinase
VAGMVVIADDLTGAADCAASSAALGCRAVVLLHSPEDQESEAAWPDTDILSIDANTRCLPAEQASQLTTRLIQFCDSRNADCPRYILFKKIDSTLRGNVAAELAALLHARRSGNPANTKLSILMAPALPAQGRTTVGGRLLVDGLPLEKTDIWRTEVRAAQSDVCQLLAGAGLSSRLIDTNTVRSGLNHLRRAILQVAKQMDVVVCDAETDSDLCAIAKASLDEPALTAWVGSAGLASEIVRASGIARNTELLEWAFAAGPTLFVVGTSASVSRQQARILEATPKISTFHATPAVLHNSAMMHTRIVQSLQSSRDVLLLLDEGEHGSNYEGQSFPKALPHLVSKCARFLGGLVATGGETARAVLDALGIDRLKLLGEVEAGLPFSVADRWVRPLPVITKAGAFGSPQGLVRCREFLGVLERGPARLHGNGPLLDHES